MPYILSGRLAATSATGILGGTNPAPTVTAAKGTYVSHISFFYPSGSGNPANLIFSAGTTVGGNDVIDSETLTADLYLDVHINRTMLADQIIYFSGLVAACVVKFYYE